MARPSVRLRTPLSVAAHLKPVSAARVSAWSETEPSDGHSPTGAGPDHDDVAVDGNVARQRSGGVHALTEPRGPRLGCRAFAIEHAPDVTVEPRIIEVSDLEGDRQRAQRVAPDQAAAAPMFEQCEAIGSRQSGEARLPADPGKAIDDPKERAISDNDPARLGCKELFDTTDRRCIGSRKDVARR